MVQFTINGTNLYTSFGLISGPGRNSSDSFFQDGDPQDVFSHDWGIDGGVEYDLQAPVVVKPRTFVIEGYLQANGEDQFNERYSGLKALLKSQVYLPITCTVENTTVTVGAKFSKWTKFNRLARLEGSGVKAEIGMQFDEIMNAEPSLNNSFTYTIPFTLA